MPGFFDRWQSVFPVCEDFFHFWAMEERRHGTQGFSFFWKKGAVSRADRWQDYTLAQRAIFIEMRLASFKLLEHGEEFQSLMGCPGH